MSPRKLAKSAAIVVAVAIVGTLMYRYFSPHHVCLEYYESEGIQSGMAAKEAELYAAGLCSKKNPFRN